MAKLQLYDPVDIHKALAEKVRTFVNPKIESKPLLFDSNKWNVIRELPEKVSLYSGMMAHIYLEKAPTIEIEEVGEPEIATFSGGLALWIEGRSEEILDLCMDYTDISRSYFKNPNLLDMAGCTINVPSDNPMTFIGFQAVDTSVTTPRTYTMGGTIFEIKKELGSTVYSV